MDSCQLEKDAAVCRSEASGEDRVERQPGVRAMSGLSRYV